LAPDLVDDPYIDEWMIEKVEWILWVTGRQSDLDPFVRYDMLDIVQVVLKVVCNLDKQSLRLTPMLDWKIVPP
jgi:hypothetical protein